LRASFATTDESAGAAQSGAEFVALESVLRAARQYRFIRHLAGAETARFH
jgi:hypothetical protein